ncbi:hypothetical protein ASC95_15520 [Pelomonas sp. Root1217]|uniref:PepSY domain-containing protein n=1 Tax=Pelomonas sp. Root1217 TaxID=1736430 RepID=UPI00070B4E71|nr:PepSY domain-containing protein [Pelomonas sp. Root1217]KQV50756.1 hypothetical protein ASC95_15520 [Pelomonas sp. Root1217]
MKYPPSVRPGVLVLLLVSAVLPASADNHCDAPLPRWQTREAVRLMADAKGWQIQQLKIDDGCYEIRGTDAQGRAFKAKIDPETLKVLKMKQDEPWRARRHDGDDDGAGRPSRTPPSDGASAPSPVSTPATAPRGRIE